jgi:hypothetical protein
MQPFFPALRWLVAATLAAIAFAIYQWPRGAIALDDAIRNGTVEIAIMADDTGSGTVMITLTRQDSSAGQIAVAVPAGTLLGPADGASQRLMTAVPVTIVVAGDRMSATAVVTALCIDPFSPPPLARAALTLPLPSGAAAAETGPLRELVACMADEIMSDGERQIAVWAASGRLLRRTPGEATAFVAAGLAQQMMAERREQLQDKRARAREIAPALSDQQIDRLIDQELQKSLPLIRTVAAEQSAELLNALRLRGRDRLSACGYRVSDMAVFQ